MDRVVEVKVQTGSSKEGIEYISDREIRVRVKAIPQKGEANERITELLAREFRVSRKNIKILKGKKSKIKLISIRVREG